MDVAAAIIASLKDDGTSMGKIYELGGPEVFTIHELVRFISIFHFSPLLAVSCSGVLVVKDFIKSDRNRC